MTVGNAGNSVVVNAKGIIVVAMRGKQTREVTEALNKEIQTHANALRSQNKKVLVYVDIQGLRMSDSTSESRIVARQQMSDLYADGCAIVGTGIMANIVMYMLRATHVGKNIRLFTDKRKAYEWLEDRHQPKARPLKLGPLAGAVMILIGVSILVGWQLNNEYLIRWAPSLYTTNPLMAAGVIIVGVGFLAYWAKKWRFLRWGGAVTIALGVAALLPLHIDYLLYGGRLTAAGGPVQVADAAAVCFVAMGSVALLAGRRGRWVEVLEYIAGGVIAALAVFCAFGQLYARDFVHNLWGGDFTMPFNVAVAFTICAVALVLLVAYRQKGNNILLQVSRTGWLVVLALVVVQAVTYGLWQQAINRNETETSRALSARTEDIRNLAASRVQAYTNSLHGFSGLFAASDFVSQNDFSAYYKSLNLAENYPGLQSVISVAAVQDKDIAAFVSWAAQNGVTSNGKQVAIKSKTGAGQHFILMYVSTGASTNIGLDLNSIPGRQEIYSHALASNGVYASGTVTVGAGTANEYPGTFLTIPVTSVLSSKPVGVVNAVLNHELFFSSLFGGSNLLQDVGVTITDPDGDAPMFTANKDTGKDGNTYTETLRVANQTWQIAVHANKTFGVGESQARFPALTLLVGQAFSVFLLLLFLLLLRARQRALDLADTITEDLQAERNKAVANDKQSTAILASIGDGVFAIDMHQRLALLNPAAQRIAGASAGEAVGKPYKDVLRFERDKNGVVDSGFVRRALDGHITSMKERTVLVRADGKRIPVADSAAPIRDAHNKIIGAIIVFRDISKEYELDRAKSEFVSLASHQLRTPLSAINWYGEMLLNGDGGKLNKTQHEYINEIFEGSQRMVELVDSLLDVSRLEVGKLANRPAPTSMAGLVAGLEKELAGAIKAKNLHFTKELAKLPDVTADPKQLRMIVQNLMSNAVKYTPEKGSVTVTLEPASKQMVAKAALSAAGSYWLFSVADTGYGIPKDQQSKIFSKLFRADNVRKLDVEGTGLGLYIVKEVVGKMGGRVWFESAESGGTTFFVVLPFTAKHSK